MHLELFLLQTFQLVLLDQILLLLSLVDVFHQLFCFQLLNLSLNFTQILQLLQLLRVLISLLFLLFGLVLELRWIVELQIHEILIALDFVLQRRV